VTRLQGKTALITGGASGIGRAAAERFRAEGAQVVVADLQPGQRQEEFFACDVTVAAEVAQLAGHVLERFGRLDILFANAGIAAHDASTTMAEADWERVFAVDVKGLWLVCRALLPSMLERRKGSIILTASQLGLVGYPGLAAYSAAKAGAVNLARTLAAEAGPDGVRVNALCPGPTLTPGLEAWFERVGDPQVHDRLAAATLLGRLAAPAEIASAALFLASDDSSYVTGAALVADGGYTAV
jgi:meso-butanediol dehydrogenase / (S,S)-butanediol dehydrogenase / diacetyl reductase